MAWYMQFQMRAEWLVVFTILLLNAMGKCLLFYIVPVFISFSLADQ